MIAWESCDVSNKEIVIQTHGPKSFRIGLGVNYIQGDTKKKQSSPKVLQLVKYYSVWNKNSIELCTTYVANICKVSTLYNKNFLFYSRSKICSRIAPRPSRWCNPEWSPHLPDLNPPRIHSVVLPQGQGVWAQPPDHPWPQGSHQNRKTRAGGSLKTLPGESKSAFNSLGRIWNKSLSGCRKRVFVVQNWNFADAGYIDCT